jgi:hypothetical protein
MSAFAGGPNSPPAYFRFLGQSRRSGGKADVLEGARFSLELAKSRLERLVMRHSILAHLDVGGESRPQHQNRKC